MHIDEDNLLFVLPLMEKIDHVPDARRQSHPISMLNIDPLERISIVGWNPMLHEEIIESLFQRQTP